MTLKELVVKHWPTRKESESLRALDSVADTLRMKHGVSYHKTRDLFSEWTGVSIEACDFEEFMEDCEGIPR